MELINDSLAVFILAYATLFPVINPLGGAPIFLNLVDGCSPAVRNKVARSVGINSFVLLIGAMIIGPRLLLFFGISLPVLQVAGGLVVAVMGWKLLNEGTKSSGGGDDSSGINDSNAMSSSFYPLTLPLTVGPGSIATVIALVANYKKTPNFDFENEIAGIIGGTLAVIAISLTIYIAYREASGIKRILGDSGTNILMRLFAFILFAIGVQIIWGGVHGLILEVMPAK
jgi:multiple antibiotic resistance protein